MANTANDNHYTDKAPSCYSLFFARSWRIILVVLLIVVTLVGGWRRAVESSLWQDNKSIIFKKSDSVSKLLLKNQTTRIGHPLTKGVLDLLSWERQSIVESENITDRKGTRLFGICRSPPGVASTCCLGSFPHAGLATRTWSNHCFKGEKVYDRFAESILQDLERTNALVDDECDVCRIVDILNKHNLTLAFTGDSIMAQNSEGFFCELQRRGSNVTMVDDWPVNPDSWDGLKRIYTHEISGPQHWQHPTSATFLFQYKPQPGNQISELEMIASSYDLVVMNFGLHYHTKQLYETTITKVLNVLSQGNISLLAHRETTAQHFNNSGGEWLDEKITPCIPHSDNDSAIFRWRERILHGKAKEIGYKVVVADETIEFAGRPVDGQRELVILPIFNLTAPAHYLHPHECTHYCSTPYLWMPVWRSLRLAMERRWDNIKAV